MNVCVKAYILRWYKRLKHVVNTFTDRDRASLFTLNNLFDSIKYNWKKLPAQKVEDIIQFHCKNSMNPYDAIESYT